jgi:hypothetical protein
MTNFCVFWFGLVVLLTSISCSKDTGVTIGITPTHIDLTNSDLILAFRVSHSSGSSSRVYFFADADCKTTHSQIGSNALTNVSNGSEVNWIMPGSWSAGSYDFFAKAVDDSSNSSSCTKLGSCVITLELTRSCSLP